MRFLESYVRMMDEETIKNILANVNCDEKCEFLHAGDCNLKTLIQFFLGAKSVFKMYLLAHLVPLLLFKLNKLKKDPRKQVWKFIVGFVNSLIFAGLSSAIVRRSICFFTKYFSYNFTMGRFPASIAAVSVFFESPVRQTQISLFCLSKGWQAAYNMLKRRKYLVVVPCGNLLLNAVSLAVITFLFFDDQNVFREGYRKALSTLLNDI